MNILHISKFYPPYHGGIEDICYSIVSAIGNSQYEQKVICFNDRTRNVKSIVDGVEVIRAGIIGELASQPLSISLYFLLKRYIKSFAPDVIHLHLPNPLACVYVQWLIPKRTKLILHWHSDIVAQKSIYKLFAPIEKRILRRADRIIATSPQYLEYSKPLATYKNKAVVIPNIISLEKMNLIGKITAMQIRECYGNKDIIFFMGRHVPYKGIKYLIEAEKFISSDCVILIAGSGPITSDLKKIAHSERIKFIGRIPDEEIGAYMEAASVFAFPSITKNEAFGVVLAEAMYWKAVPVTFTIEGSGVNWVNLNGVTGLEVANGDIKAYGEAIDSLLKNSEMRKQYAESAHNRVLSLFTINSIKKQIEELYNTISISKN